MYLKNYYSILGISPRATQEEVAMAYRTMAKKWHPDANSNSDTTSQMQLIIEANTILSDRDKRRDYDIKYYTQFYQRIQPQQKTEVKIEKCYYCDRNLANKEFSYKTTLYKETKRTHFPQRKVWFSTVDIEIPRCGACHKTHKISSNLFLFLPLISFAALGIILGLISGLENDWLLYSIVGLLLGWFLGRILSAIDKSIIVKDAGIKKESDISACELVVALHKRGWSKNKPTA
ncbi:J domain-containing protein [Paludibacter sp. 221]|uniref:J domain-containing protein n=1 Tax=Paludibacter sp. 221 TaxID=2302939 RepID=UPI0013D6C29E|nr:J domain-containing protein [Paludibacter sp. 221]NDV46140.1 J domain-containing protein [Paludibacter sp. 221]